MSSVDIIVPDLPESVADATVATWHKKPGDSVQRDEVLVEIETDKVILEVPASADGVLEAILEDEGATVTSRQALGRLKEGTAPARLVLPSRKRKSQLRLSVRTPRLKKRATMRSARQFVA